MTVFCRKFKDMTPVVQNSQTPGSFIESIESFTQKKVFFFYLLLLFIATKIVKKYDTC